MDTPLTLSFYGGSAVVSHMDGSRISENPTYMCWRYTSPWERGSRGPPIIAVYVYRGGRYIAYISYHIYMSVFVSGSGGPEERGR